MKLQYLGDSKDSFKWDYHDFLARSLNASSLKILWQMTPDDGSNDGAIPPDRFGASPEILELCRELKRTRDPYLLKKMPQISGSEYCIKFFEKHISASAILREQFFKVIKNEPR